MRDPEVSFAMLKIRLWLTNKDMMDSSFLYLMLSTH
jgi:hypothetical protein